MKFTFNVFVQGVGLPTVYTVQFLLLDVNIRLKINLLNPFLNLIDQALKEMLLVFVIEL